MDHTSDHHEPEDEKNRGSVETGNGLLKSFDKKLLRSGEHKPSGTAEDLALNEHLTATYWG